METKVLDLVVKMIDQNKSDLEKKMDQIILAQEKQAVKIDELLSFKWKLAGIASVISLIGGTLINFAITKLKLGA